MKKNIFKKLAFVLAFAMVFATLSPAASAFAASKPALSAKSKTLLLNEKARTSYNFDVKNKVKGSTYKWTSSNTKVATVNSKNGVVTAKKIGKATIKLVITLKTKKLATLVAPVTVKENIKTLAIDNAPTKAIAVSGTYNFNIDYTTKTGHKTTDIVRFEITKGNDAKVASIAKNGVFASTVAGEFEVTALAFQSEAKYAAYLKGDTTVVTATSVAAKITVVPSIVSITQKTTTKFDVAFDTVVKDVVTKDNIVITTADGVKLAIVKGVSFDATGKIATVETYINLTDKAVYTVSYDKMLKDFTASNGAVVKVVITGPSIISDNELTALTSKLFDANGVEVSAAANASVTYAVTNNIGWIDNGKLILFNIGNTSIVKATYHTATYDTSGNEITIASELFTVVAVDDASATVNGLTAWTISDLKSDKSTADFASATHALSLNTDAKYLYVKALGTDGNAFYNGFKFTSTDTSKLIIDETTGRMITVAAGSVGVIIKSGNFQTVVTVNITAEAAASSVTANKSYAKLSNASLVNATETFVLTVKDQYSNTLTAEKLDVESLSRPSTVEAASAKGFMASSLNGKVAEFKFSAQYATVAGTYTYKLTASGKSVVVTVVVGTPDGTPTSYKIVASSTLDLNVNGDTANLSGYEMKINAYSYDKNGYAIAPVSMSSINIEHSDGTDYTPTILSGSTYSFNAVTGVSTASGTAITKAIKTGNFTISGTTTVAGVVKNLVPEFIVVSDTQATVKIAQESSNISIDQTADLYAELAKCFTVSSNVSATVDFEIKSTNVSTTAVLTNGKYATGTYSVLVKKLTVTEDFGDYVYTRDIDTNKVITVVVK